MGRIKQKYKSIKGSRIQWNDYNKLLDYSKNQYFKKEQKKMDLNNGFFLNNSDSVDHHSNSNHPDFQLPIIQEHMQPSRLNSAFYRPNTGTLENQRNTNTLPNNSQRLSTSSNKITTIKLTSKTWTKDSYGLFDYQAKQDQYVLQTDNIEQTTYIVKDNLTNKTVFLKELNDNKKTSSQKIGESVHSIKLPPGRQQQTILGQLIVDRSKQHPSFKLKIHKPADLQLKNSLSSKQSLQQKIETHQHSHSKNYLVPFILADNGNAKSNGYLLKPGNIIKFGRVEYLVLEVFNGKNKQTIRQSMYLNDQTQVFDVFRQKQIKKLSQTESQTQFDKENINCKICLCNQQTDQDPLISPCSCKGYCGLIHTHCLKQWINNKVKKQTSGLAVSYNFTKFQCQICKAPFPKIVKTQIEQVQMMTIFKPEKPYIMLQSLDPLNNLVPNHVPHSSMSERQRLLHVISTDQKHSIRIGRANQCQIRLMDISVSRKHAQIKLIGNDFFIKDTGAKFGTLVQWSNLANNNKGDMITINRKKPLKIQLGRTAFQLTVEDLSQEIDTQ